MRGSTFFIGVILAILVALLAISATYVWDARLFPLLIGIPTSVLIVAQIMREVFAKGKSEKNAQGGEAIKKRVSWKATIRNVRPYLFAVAWVGGFILMIYLLGYLIAVPLFLLLYLKLHGEKWLTTIGISAVLMAVMYFGFVLFLQVPFYEGVLLSYFL